MIKPRNYINMIKKYGVNFSIFSTIGMIGLCCVEGINNKIVDNEYINLKKVWG